MNDKVEKYVDYDGAQRLLGIRKPTLYTMVHAKRIPHIRIGPRFVRFEVAALLRWIDEHQVKTAGEK